MKILFLDFDGVLNSHQHHIREERYRKEHWLARKRRQLLNRVLSPFNPGTMKFLEKTGLLEWYRDLYVGYWGSSGEFCPVACSNVQHILQEDPEVRVVISSTWRAWGLRVCRRILRRNGIDPRKVLGITAHLPGQNGRSTPRGLEIQRWLDNHELRIQGKPLPERLHGEVDESPREPVTHFAILDDDSDMEHLQEHLVHTSSLHGCLLGDSISVLRKLGHRIPDGNGYYLI